MSLSLNFVNIEYPPLEGGYQNNIQWLDMKVSEIRNLNLEKYSEKAKFAFYINAYNILTLWAVKKKLENNPLWKGNISLLSKIKFFYLSRFKVAGKKTNLFNLENKILRRRFDDPRVHFVINCASVSCPSIPEKQLNATKLDEQLDFFTDKFVNDGFNVQYDENQNVLKLNLIFKWYKKDFKKNGGILTFISKYYRKKQIRTDTKVEYLNYDWSLKI
jgi:hypothetical protein